MASSPTRMQYTIDMSSLRLDGDRRDPQEIGRGLAYDLTELRTPSVISLCKEGKIKDGYGWGYFVRSVGPEKYLRIEGNDGVVLLTDIVNFGRRRLAEAIGLNQKDLKRYDGNGH